MWQQIHAILWSWRTAEGQIVPGKFRGAFRKSEQLGVDAIEVVVHLTKDGRIVVMHDDNLKRITGIDHLIRDMTIDELPDLALPNCERISSVEDVFARFHAMIIIELKSPM